MSKPTGIEAAAREIQDRYSLTGEFHDLETAAARKIRSDLIGIIAKHCVDDYLFQTAQRSSIKNAGEIIVLRKKLEREDEAQKALLHGFNHIQEDIKAAVHAATIAANNSPHHE
jgi:hypothetical protein